MRRGRARERGSVLFDYFVAVSFFMTVFAAFFEMTALKVRAAGEADRRLRAVAAAESRLAEARAGAAAPGSFPVPGPGELAGELAIEPRESGLARVTATVRWRETKGDESSVVLTTVVRTP